MKVVIEAGLELTIKAAGGFIKIDPLGVWINGNLVLVNSGGAPGIGVPGLAMPPMPPVPPQPPDEADDGTAGADVTFTKAPTAPDAEPYQAHVFEKPQWPMGSSLAQAAAMKEAAKTGAPLCSTCPHAGK